MFIDNPNHIVFLAIRQVLHRVVLVAALARWWKLGGSVSRVSGMRSLMAAIGEQLNFTAQTVN